MDQFTTYLDHERRIIRTELRQDSMERRLQDVEARPRTQPVPWLAYAKELWRPAAILCLVGLASSSHETIRTTAAKALVSVLSKLVSS